MVRRFTASLQVDTKIVGLLSKSTYERSFASAIRELVSNAYDADALTVNIRVNNDFSTIQIEDDGNGMTHQEFVKYLTIAGTKSKSEYTRKYKRKRIGQFGIGFLSVFPFCEYLEIITTTENSKDLLSTKIPAKRYMESAQEVNVEDIAFEGKIIENNDVENEHYTIIKLLNPTYLVKQYFSDIQTRKRESIYNWKAFKRFRWELQEDLPIAFHPNKNSVNVLKYNEPIGISVFLNGGQLHRNELPGIILEQGEKEIEGLICKYVFATDYQSIRPLEARGVKICVNNVGIGDRTDFDLKRDRGFSRLHWIAGEIHFSGSAKEFLSISRNSFVSSPVIDIALEAFADKLRSLAYYIEDIAIAEKNITEAFKAGKKEKVMPKKQEVQANIDVLVKKGFEVVEQSNIGIQEKPITVDKKKKKVLIADLDSFTSELDKIEVLNQNFTIEYAEALRDNSIPCEMKGKSIVINSSYPLFKSKTYGKVFKKFHILLLVASQKSKDSEKMYRTVLESFLKEFNEYLK